MNAMGNYQLTPLRQRSNLVETVVAESKAFHLWPLFSEYTIAERHLREDYDNITEICMAAPLQR